MNRKEEEEEEIEEAVADRATKVAPTEKKQTRKRTKFSTKDIIDLESHIAKYDSDLEKVMDYVKKRRSDLIQDHTEASVTKKVRELNSTRQRIKREEQLATLGKQLNTARPPPIPPSVIVSTPSLAMDYPGIRVYHPREERVLHVDSDLDYFEEESVLGPVVVAKGEYLYTYWPFSPQLVTRWSVELLVGMDSITLRASPPLPTVTDFDPEVEAYFGESLPLPRPENYRRHELVMKWKTTKLIDKEATKIYQSAFHLIYRLKTVTPDPKLYPQPRLQEKDYLHMVLECRKRELAQQAKQEVVTSLPSATPTSK